MARIPFMKDQSEVVFKPQTAFNKAQAAKYSNQPLINTTATKAYANSECASDDPVSDFLPREVYKPYLERLVRYMSEDDARKVITTVFAELSKENPNIKLSEVIEASIIQFTVDKVV